MCAELKLTINKRKSGIIILKHTRAAKDKTATFMGYPLCQKYKYLGIWIDDKCDTFEDIKTRREKAKTLKTKRWILTKPSLSGKARM